MISGQNANDKMPMPKTPIEKMLTPTRKPEPPYLKHINQWISYIGAQTGYHFSLLTPPLPQLGSLLINLAGRQLFTVWERLGINVCGPTYKYLDNQYFSKCPFSKRNFLNTIFKRIFSKCEFSKSSFPKDFFQQSGSHFHHCVCCNLLLQCAL